MTKLLRNDPAPDNRNKTRHDIDKITKLRVLMNPYSKQRLNPQKETTKSLVRRHTLPPPNKVHEGHHPHLVTLSEPHFFRRCNGMEALAAETEIAHVSGQEEPRYHAKQIIG
ncbi:hypothetical protein V8G54_005009 [Vigna mungo]|uniref:Uncharacterized protein n=1 Tax=Vigna mungo TaxID=3915 RepID=A0AAQ3PJE3_VIGMU